MQFRGTTISFNGVNSTRYNLYLCNVDNGLDRQLGTGRSFSMEDGNLISVDDDNPTFDIQLVKLNKHGDPSPITDTELFEIKRWLYSPKDFKPLMIDRQPTVYYGMFVGGQIWQNECNQGYLTLQFQLNSGHAYTTQQNSVYRVNGTKTINLRSKHNYELYNKIVPENVRNRKNKIKAKTKFALNSIFANAAVIANPNVAKIARIFFIKDILLSHCM